MVTDTELGKVYNLTRVGSTSMFPDAIDDISISFEERGDNVLRFKVCTFAYKPLRLSNTYT